MPVGYTSQRSVQESGFASIGLLTPLRRLYPLPVRQASVLPSASSRFRLAVDTLAVQLTLPLIWSDPVHSCESVGLFLLLFEDGASSSRGRCERRLISLIFAGRNRIILIRRELPLTYVASPAEPVAKGRRGFSFVPAPAAAGPVLEWSSVVHSLGGLCFFLLWKVLAFAFVGSLFVMPPSAACRPFPL
jgi:hypothetical protein